MPKSDGQAALFKPQQDDPQCSSFPSLDYVIGVDRLRSDVDVKIYFIVTQPKITPL